MAEKIALKKEFDYYISHQNELVEKYNGKYIVIKDEKVIGEYDTAEAAITETARGHAVGTFLVQKCSPGTDDYTITFHSRVALV